MALGLLPAFAAGGWGWEGDAVIGRSSPPTPDAAPQPESLPLSPGGRFPLTCAAPRGQIHALSVLSSRRICLILLFRPQCRSAPLPRGPLLPGQVRGPHGPGPSFRVHTPQSSYPTLDWGARQGAGAPHVPPARLRWVPGSAQESAAPRSPPPLLPLPPHVPRAHGHSGFIMWYSSNCLFSAASSWLMTQLHDDLTEGRDQ